jgi:hypothetical protein
MMLLKYKDMPIELPTIIVNRVKYKHDNRYLCINDVINA